MPPRDSDDRACDLASTLHCPSIGMGGPLPRASHCAGGILRSMFYLTRVLHPEWYIYTMEYYSAIKKERNNDIGSNMDGPRDYYTK